MLKQHLVRLSVLSATALVMVGCGRSGSLNQTQLPNNASGLAAPTGSATYMAPVAQPQTAGTAQAMAGGRAVATSGGYVYEQDPSANNTAYNYYNQQNPCLFPQAGQQVACQSGSTGYYASNQPQQATGAYPQYAAPTTGYATGGAYPAQSGYPQQNGAYASSYPQQGTAYTANTGYTQSAYPQTAYPQTAYPQSTAPTYSSYNAQTAAPVAASSTTKAQSRLNPNPVSSQTSGNGSNKISF